MNKKVYLAKGDTQSRISNAIKDMANLIGQTLGPGGRPILLEREGQSPLSTKDGVTVAKEYRARGELERVVTDAAREVCERTVRDAGDGTTTAIVLADALVEEGQKWLNESVGFSPQLLCRNLQKCFKEEIKPEILNLSKSIRNLPIKESTEIIKYVALVSANHDEEIAQAVAEAVSSVGEDGMVIAEEGIGAETQVKEERGFPINTGLRDLGGSASVAFINRPDMGDVALERAYVVLYDGEINDVSQLTLLMQDVHSEVDSQGRSIHAPLIVFAHRFSDAVLKFMATNTRRNVMTAIPVMTPRTGQSHGAQQFLHDLAAYVGADVRNPIEKPLQSCGLSNLGFCEAFKMGPSQTVVLGEPEQEDVEKRIDELKKQMKNQSDYDQDLIRYRIGRLTGGVATVYAGGKTALEARERHARVVDAISAVRSALDMGVVPGGGATLQIVANKLEENIDAGHWKNILVNAFRVPTIRIIENAGIRAPTYCKKPKPVNGQLLVLDALKNELVDWWDGGIMDPARVTLAAVENALSVAQLLMTLGGVVAIEKTEGEQQVERMQEGMMKAIQEA